MILTENAGLDDKTNDDYKDICDDIRNYDESQAGKKNTGKDVLSWDKFVLHIGSFRYKAQWANWRADKANLQWDMKNDLRRAVRLPELPKPVQQVLEEHVSENAKISVGLYGDNREMTLQGKWATYVQLSDGPLEVFVIDSIVEDKPNKLKPKRAKRVGFMRPSVQTKYDSWRKKLGRSWEEVVQAGLISIERGDVDGKKGKGGRLNGR